MSAVAPELDACGACLRRTALVAALSGRIEHEWRLRRGRPQLLALPDAVLLEWGRDPAVVAGYERFAADAALDACLAAGVGVVCRCSARYPAALHDLPDPPAVLHLRGDPACLGGAPQAAAVPGDRAGGRAAALVGARRATPAGLEVARSLGRGLAAAGVPVVSGMALGVDAAAHAGALEADGPTVAVLATGADTPYPARHTALHRRIAACGCAVSELPPGSSPRRWAFPARNRIIAALAGVTVVVEGGDRSGSLITADFAADLGRAVAAVPGPVASPLSAGPNLLLKLGAELVRDTGDVLDLLAAPGAAGSGLREPVVGPPGPASASASASRPEAAMPVPDDLGPRPRATLERIEAGADTMAALLRSAAGAFEVSVDLGELEARGLVRRLPDGRYLRRLR